MQLHYLVICRSQVRFADINVSQGSVATYTRCGGIFNMRLTANLPRNLLVKKFCKSVKIWQNYGRESVAPFFGPPRRQAHANTPSRLLYLGHQIEKECRLRLCRFEFGVPTGMVLIRSTNAYVLLTFYRFVHIRRTRSVFILLTSTLGEFLSPQFLSPLSSLPSVRSSLEVGLHPSP